MRRLAQKCVLILLGFVVALGFVEMGVRMFDPQPPLMYWPDPVLGWVHPANSDFTYFGNSGQVLVHFNSKGLRDIEHSYEKRSGIYRVLVLGDSFTEGVDVDLSDTFPKKLEKLLNKGGRLSEVINAGVGGYGTDQEFLFLTQEGWKYEPDLVVLAFTIVNDVHDNLMKGYCTETPAGLVCGQKLSGVKRRALVYVKYLAQKHLQSYHYFRNKTARLYSLRLMLSKLGLTEFNDADYVRRGLPFELSLLLNNYSTDITKGWQLTTAILAQMNEDAKRHHARFLIVLIPSEIQLEREKRERVLKAYGLYTTEIETDKPNQIILGFGAATGIPVVDLLPSFRAAVLRGERLHDNHWNKAGHSLAAVTICRQMLRTRMVPGLVGC